MSATTGGLRARFLRWIDAPSVSVTERIHLRALQVVQLLFILLWVLTEVHGASHGVIRMANLVFAVFTVASFWAIRRGRYRLSAGLLLGAVVGSIWIGFLGTGLTVQLNSIRYVVVPQLLAALALGAAALWIVTGTVGLAIVLAAAVDAAAGVGPPGNEDPWLAALQALLYLLVVALLLDRMGAVLRRALSRSLENESKVERARATIEEQEHAVESLYHRLEQSYEETLRSLSAALDLRDRETNGHSARVVGYSLLLGERLGLGEQALRDLRWGALLHDIGKIAVPDHILHKGSSLDEAEWEIVRRHPEQGLEMLKDVSYLGPSLEVVFHHHERWDGSGYPRGLSGESIPRLARIFSVVDTYDAMTSGRPYRKALPEADAQAELRRVAGQQLDPEIVEAFLAVDPDRLAEVRRHAAQLP